jgi:serine/threonine protein kinase
VLLGDFGITEATRRPSPTASRPGTLFYMSPEHLCGKPCMASDQYALAVCVYEWLTGQYPFEGTPTEIRWQHLHNRPTSLRTLAPDIPLAMERVVLRALSKDPQRRYPSVGDFVEAFREAMPPALPPATALSTLQVGWLKARRWVANCRKWLLTRLQE